MDQKKKLSYLTVIALTLVFSLVSVVAVAKNDNAKAQGQGKTVSKTKAVKTAELKNFKKADVAKGETNAKVYKEKKAAVVKALWEVAIEEDTTGNEEVSEEIQQIVQEEEQVQEETTEAIEEVEGRGKLKTLVIGADYKNLGQLRSSLVHSRNQIRKLTKALAQVQSDTDQILLQEQLTYMMQERERIKTVIGENEANFSLFGWLSRFLNGYETTPVEDAEEEDLTEEVVEVIDDTTDTTEPILDDGGVTPGTTEDTTIDTDETQEDEETVPPVTTVE